MNKKLIFVFAAGWLLAVVLPPQRIFTMFSKKP